MRPRILRFLLFLVLVVSLNTSQSLLAVTSKKVLIIDIPRLALPEINKSQPNFLKLLKNSAVGLMTIPLAEPVALEQVYLAFNSGVQLKAAEENYLLFDVSEEYKGLPAGQLYQSLTGEKAPSEGVVHLGLTKVRQVNSKDITYNIGMFGRILHQNSIKTGAIGNADADLISRCGSLLLIDEDGKIDYGAIGGESTQFDPYFPFGLRTDTAQILTTWREFKEKAQVIAITLGDLERLERFSSYLSERQWQDYRQQVLVNYDRFLGRILNETDFQNTLIIVFTALPSARNAEKGDRMTPVIIKGPGFGGGLIASASTRKPGILTCYDLPTTLFRFLDIQRTKYFNGHALTRINGYWHSLKREQLQLVKNYNVRWPLLTAYGYLLIGLVLVGLMGAIFWPNQYQFFQWLSYGYLFLLTIPAVFLIEAAINPLDWVSIISWTIGLGGLLWLIAWYFSRGDHLVILSFITTFTLALIIFEGFFNGFLELKSFLGYSAVAGARFYGIGNEYMGFLLGVYIVMISLNLARLKRYKRELLWTANCFLAIFLAHPNLGANIGGGITALIGLGITTYLWLERPIRVKEIVGLIGAMVTLLILVGLWDIYISHNMTHFGQFLMLLKDQDFGTILDIVKRKFELNSHLIAYTPWTKVLMLLLIVFPVIYKRPPQKIAQLIQKYPYQIRGFLGLTITAILALVIEDSGIVTVTTMYMFGFLMLLLVFLKEWATKRSV